MTRNRLRNIRHKHITRVVAFVLAFFIISSALPVFATSLPYGVGDYSECPYSADTANCSISITNNGFSLFMNVTPTISGSCTIQSDQVTVATYDPYGYSLTLNDEATTSKLLPFTGGSSYINTSTGTLASPTSLTNAWGYRVDGLGAFGAGGPTASVVNADPSSLDNGVAISSIHFAGIKTSSGSPDTIGSTSGLNTSVLTKIWYGVCLDDSVATTPDTYTSTVLYTATAN